MIRTLVVLGCIAVLGCQGRQATPAGAAPDLAAASPPASLKRPASSKGPARPTGPASEPAPAPASDGGPAASAPAPASRPAAPAPSYERRCGWVDNPTPGNWSLIDADATWEIGAQGGYQAAGEMPDFGDRWVRTNGFYGYGCACMRAKVDRARKRVIAYRDVRVQALSTCKADKKLPPPP